jgi:hypothetical protein
MRNVTISIDEEIVRWAEDQAAVRGGTVSGIIEDLLRQQVKQRRSYEQAKRSFFSRGSAEISRDGR